MRPSFIRRQAASALLLSAFALAASAQGANFGSATPSVGDIISNLKGEGADGDGVAGVRTRALRPGAATQATVAPEAERTPARAPAISMQVQFEFGSDRIAPASVQTMDNLARALGSPELQGRAFTVIGHTDGVGSADYNLRLSQRRAASVKAYLVRNGIEATRLRTEGKGLSELLDRANPRAAENRRVEIVAGG